MFSAISSAISSVIPGSSSEETAPAETPVAEEKDDQPKSADQPAVESLPSAAKASTDTTTLPNAPTNSSPGSNAKPKSKAKRGPRRPARRGGGKSDASSGEEDSDDVTSASSDGEGSADSTSEDEEDDVDEDGRSAGDREEDPRGVIPDDTIPTISTSPDDKVPQTKTPAPTTPAEPNTSNNATSAPTSKSLFPGSTTLMDALDWTETNDLEEVNFDEFERKGLGALKRRNGKKVGGPGAGQGQVGAGTIEKKPLAGKGKAVAGPGGTTGSPVGPNAKSKTVPITSSPSTPMTQPSAAAQPSKPIATPSSTASGSATKPLSEEKEKRLAEKRAKQKEKFKAKKALKMAASKEEKQKQKQGSAVEASAVAGPSTGAGNKEPEKHASEAQPGGSDPAQPIPGSESIPIDAEDTSSPSAEAATTSASTPADTSSPAPLPGASGVGGRLNNRQAYQNRVAADPAFVPRVGKFWTHDQRHYAPGAFGSGGSEYSGLRDMSDYWRGRGGRGGFRGRGGPGFGRGAPGGRGGRGGFIGGQQHAQQQQAEQQGEGSQQQPSSTDESSVAKSAPILSDPAILSIAEPFQTASPAEAEDLRPRRKGEWAGDAGRSDAKSWNHDGYVEMAAEDDRRRESTANGARGGPRGRGRGRGAPRGGFAPHARGGMPVGQGGYIGGNPGQFFVDGQAGTEAIRVKLPGSAGVEAILPAEVISVAPTAEVLQQQTKASSEREVSDVVVRLPKTPSAFSPPPLDSSAAIAPLSASVPESASLLPTAEPVPIATQPAAIPSSPEPARVSTDTPEPSYLAANLQLQAEVAALREQQEIMRRRELHIQEEMHRLELERRRVSSAVNPSSEAGSLGSGPGSAALAHSYGTPESYLPPGVGMTSSGGFFELATGQPVVFVPDAVAVPMGNGYTPSMSPANAQQIPQEAYGRHQQQSFYPSASTQSPTFHAIPPHLQQRPQNGMYSPYPTGYNGGSPINSPYAGTPPSNLGYFVPPRAGSKIQIRAPDGLDGGHTGAGGDQGGRPGASSHPLSNPYFGQQLGSQAANGRQMQGRAYYPEQQGYYPPPQGQYEQAAYGEYGYGGEYGVYQ